MIWTVITVSCASDATDAVTEALLAMGCGGVVLQGNDPVQIQGSLPISSSVAEKVDTLRMHLDRLPEFGLPPLTAPIALHDADDTEWVDVWKKHFHTAKIGNRVVIQPSWEEYTPQADEVVLNLDPGMAFGTGSHPTTRLCLLALEERIVPGMTIADVGTGSGILAIAAVKLGAALAYATDIDPLAREVSEKNATHNGLQGRVLVQEMETFEQEAKACHLIVANIIAQIVIDLAPTIPPRLNAEGIFIASGIVEEYHDRVKEAFEALGMTYLETKRDDIWVCLVFRKTLQNEPTPEGLPALPRGNYPWAV
ncbi:MAG: 50S ribosomal protein L11 methyltransferase [Armatimonadetes bacterium]|nr:50S ribosomal protein L11 methyltransferase [Armatimonadota bacterium]